MRRNRKGKMVYLTALITEYTLISVSAYYKHIRKDENILDYFAVYRRWT